MTNATSAGNQIGAAEKLPPGRTISREWQRVGFVRAEPEADPQRATGGGGAADAGAGEASWQRQLRPSHREIVRRFFTRGEEGK